VNKIIPITTEHITPSRTIEIFNLLRFEESKQVYVYNFEGKHFSVFESLVDLIRFFEVGKEPRASFDSECDLDEFLDRLPLGDDVRKLNLKFNYMYRDGANYKQFGSVVFNNSSGLSIDEVSEGIRKKLISEEFFVPKEWGIPTLYAAPYNPEYDHEWHEFEGLEETIEAPSHPRDILEILKD
jgi:hypothetical protein